MQELNPDYHEEVAEEENEITQFVSGDSQFYAYHTKRPRLRLSIKV